MGTSYFHCPIMTWIPVVETENFGQERFLIDEPNKLFLSGNSSKVNVIAGVTADEFIEPAAGEIVAMLTDLNDNCYRHVFQIY